MKEKNTRQKEQLESELEGVDFNADENIKGTNHLTDPMTEENEEEKLREKINELNDKYIRLFADFDNFKRRNAKERIELIQTAGKDVIVDLLDVLDDSERAQTQLEATEDVKQIKEGVQLVFTKLKNILQAKGLKPMESINKEFDADLHEAITEMDAGDDMKGKVVAEIQKGYFLNDKIIRFAKVVVGK
jgi:molecular chaperone GrpE